MQRDVFAFMAAALLASACGGEPRGAVRERSEFLESVAARPAPDLTTLAERVRSRADGAFEDLLKLRESGGADAVPVLVETLDAEAGTSRIFGFAAAQALFRAGTNVADADAALRRHLLADSYPWRLALDYTFHWEMQPADRDRFLAGYVLRPTGDELRARLAVSPTTLAAGEDALFTLTLTNTTAQPRALLMTDGAIEADLVLRAASGHFLRTEPVVQNGTGVAAEYRWVALGPEASVEIEFVRAFLPHAPGAARFVSHGVVRELNVETGDGAGGAFQVTGVVARTTLPPGAGEPPQPAWRGRAVCPPIALEIVE